MMLSEEKAIENLKDFKSINVLYGNTFVMFLEQLKKYQESTEIVLNIIDRLQKENSENKYLYQKALGDVVRLQKENEEKDEEMKSLGKLFDERGEQLELKQIQIDLMSKYIDKCNYVDSEECQFQYDFKIKGCIEKGNCIDCIKQYFENKVKEDNING